MKRFCFLVLVGLVFCLVGKAQSYFIGGNNKGEFSWSFDGQTLSIQGDPTAISGYSIPDYDLRNNLAPWVKRNLSVKKVKFGSGIKRIGACAFANCNQLETVEFYNDKTLQEIGWGAFYNCINLFNFSMPVNIRKIERIAFANCSSLPSVSIPSQTKVEDHAFLSCSKLHVIDVASNAILGKSVFATEIKDGGLVSHVYYRGEIRNMSSNITLANCHEYGLSKESMEKYIQRYTTKKNDETASSQVDTIIPEGKMTQNKTYALIIGNENYMFVANVPYARHDAKIFSEYCKKTLGIPATNIHLCYDATKHMLLEQEIDDWLRNGIGQKEDKNLIIYYAGHGVPDIDDRKSYLLPTDVYGTKPKHGISLDDFYATIGNLGFKQVTIFMDACFSGVSRNNDALNEGLRGTEIVTEDSKPSTGNLIVFAAAQENETAQGYVKEGHGLFTYYLLKEIQESEGNISYEELAKNLKSKVSIAAPTLELRKSQTPTTKVSDNVKDKWKDIHLCKPQTPTTKVSDNMKDK